MTKNRTDSNIIQAEFKGGNLDGKTLWVDKADELIGQCSLTTPVNEECPYYAVEEIYKLESKGTPLKYILKII
jgi:hypothetical protein